MDEMHVTEEEVCPSHIRTFAGIVKGQFNFKTGENGMTESTVRSHLAAVSSYYKWRKLRNPALLNPVKSFKYYRTERTRKVVPIDSAAATAMYERAESATDKAVIKTLCGSGTRLGEFIQMDKTSITLDVAWEGSQQKLCGIVEVIGKGRKVRTVLISHSASIALVNYLEVRGDDHNPALVLSSRGKRISRRTVQRIVHRAAVKAGIGHAHPHQLRHFFGTQAVTRGVPDEEVQKLMGHVDLQTTYRYVRLTEEYILEQYRSVTDEWPMAS